MADLPNRLKYEAELAREVADILARNRAEIESLQAAPQTERTLRERLLGFLALIFTLGAGTAAGELGIALVSDGAAKAWADSYSTWLANRITSGVRNRLSKARTKDLTGEAGLVAKELDKVLKPNTWDNLAATEITRANTAGGEFTATIYNIGRLPPTNAPGEGPLVGTPVPGSHAVTPPELPPLTPPSIPEPALAIWHTSRDQRVCPICRPLHGRPREEWQTVAPLGPPAHVSCRCFVDYQLEATESVHESTDGEKGVWRTIRGAKVFIKDGKITKGPKALIDKTPDEAESDEKPKRKRKPAAAKADKVKGDSKEKPEPKEDKPKGKVKQTDTKEFKDWFGDSKVVDENGKPLVVYHGSGTTIDEFKYDFTDQGNDQLGSGFYFTTSDTEANGYTTATLAGREKKLGGTDKPSVVSAYLAIENPLDADATGAITKSQISRLINKSPIVDDRLLDFGDIDYEGRASVMATAIAAYESDDDTRKLETLFKVANDFYPNRVQEFNAAVRDVLGYDGVVKDFGERTHWVAFFPNQIKSATGNRGTFSRKSNRIDEQQR